MILAQNRLQPSSGNSLGFRLCTELVEVPKCRSAEVPKCRNRNKVFSFHSRRLSEADTGIETNHK